MPQNSRAKVYLAGPLFSAAELAFNLLLTKQLEELVDVYLPQRDGRLMSKMVAEGMEPGVAACCVFKRDIDAILECDCLIVILDGRTIDEGVAFELGVAFSAKKRCFAIQTDSRRLAIWGNNPMITGALEVLFHSVDDLVAWFNNQQNGAKNNFARK